MSQDVESIYEQYMSNLKQALPNVDPNFAHRVMYMERKLADELVSEPHIEATIEYSPGVDMDKKLLFIRERHQLEAEYADKHNILHVVGRIKIDKIKGIAADHDVVKIKGKADPSWNP